MITLLLGTLLWHFNTAYLECGETNEALNLKNVLSLILNPTASIFKLKLLTSLSLDTQLIILLNGNADEPVAQERETLLKGFNSALLCVPTSHDIVTPMV